MIWGVYYKNSSRNVLRESLTGMAKVANGSREEPQLYINQNFGFACQGLYSHECCLHGDDKTYNAIVFQGTLYNIDELKKLVYVEGKALNSAHLVSLLYRMFGERFVEKMRGKFAFALYDEENKVFLLGRDRVGIESLFIFENEHNIIFGSSIDLIAGHQEVEKELNIEAIHQYLLYCYNPSLSTVFKDIHKLRPGHIMIHRPGTATINKHYWKLSFANLSRMNEKDVQEKLLELLRDAVRIRIDPHNNPGVFLSGGMDSSTIVSLMRGITGQPIHTFSYRCRRESFDESRYAEIVSDHYHTNHTVVEYPAEAVISVSELVKSMDEPFCDVGINIATNILGKAANGNVSYVLTGDGGDELFGGHPVYLADPVGRFIDGVPGFIKNPLLWVGLRLRDSEKKKDFRVKWKRFSISYQFPQSLLSHRWRIYYTPDEMVDLLNNELLSQLEDRDPYKTMMMINDEADGLDYLSKSLYSDYQTVVGFYLRRMDLLRHYGIESRFPMLDARLIQYGATIPSTMKIRGRSDTKYILKKTMEDSLPREIVYRKDKLGHSIPLKNWMREDVRVKSFMMDILTPERLKKRGLFKDSTVSKYIEEHMQKIRNHSHRLWALMVLELWLREHFDQS